MPTITTINIIHNTRMNEWNESAFFSEDSLSPATAIHYFSVCTYFAAEKCLKQNTHSMNEPECNKQNKKSDSHDFHKETVLIMDWVKWICTKIVETNILNVQSHPPKHYPHLEMLLFVYFFWYRFVAFFLHCRFVSVVTFPFRRFLYIDITWKLCIGQWMWRTCLLLITQQPLILMVITVT